MGEKKRKSLCLNGTFLKGVGEQKWQRRKKILVSFQRHIIQLPTVYICSTTKTQICASLVGVFFFFFFSMEGREEERKKGKIRATRDQGDKRKEKKNEGTRDDRAMIESERTSTAISQCLPRSREDRERKGRGKK